MNYEQRTMNDIIGFVFSTYIVYPVILHPDTLIPPVKSWLKVVSFVSILFINLSFEPGRLSGAKEARFKPPNEPPSDSDNPNTDADDGNYTA